MNATGEITESLRLPSQSKPGLHPTTGPQQSRRQPSMQSGCRLCIVNIHGCLHSSLTANTSSSWLIKVMDAVWILSMCYLCTCCHGYADNSLANAAFSWCGIDGKLGGLTPMNSYARLVCIRGIKTTVIGIRGNPATANCCVILKRYNVILPQIVFYLALLFQSAEHYIE